jgi:pimeloyl-ACP methyl ester carboxylesterase
VAGSPLPAKPAVLAETNGVADIWLVDGTTGELVTNLTGPAGAEVLSQPSWAPDGSAIAYAATGPGGDSDLYLVSTDGLGVTPLLEAAGQDDAQPGRSGPIAFISIGTPSSRSTRSTSKGTGRRPVSPSLPIATRHPRGRRTAPSWRSAGGSTATATSTS